MEHMMESFISDLYDVYSNDPNASNYIDSNMGTSAELELFASQHNLILDFSNDDSRKRTTESFKRVVDAEIEHLQ